MPNISYPATNTDITRKLTVGLGGDVDYTSIATAITAAIDGGASVISPWIINIAPGTYTEDPMIVQAGIILSADVGPQSNTVNVVARDEDSDLFTITGGSITGLKATGVTDPEKCLFRCTGSGVQVALRAIGVYDCSKGIVVSDGAVAVITDTLDCVITRPDISVDTVAEVTGVGSEIIVDGGTFLVASGILSSYTVNPIQTVIRATDYGKAYIANASFRVLSYDTTSDCICADEGAEVLVQSCDFMFNANCLHIGSSGDNTKIICQSCRLADNSLNANIESVSGKIWFMGTADIQRKSLIDNNNLTGYIQYTDSSVAARLRGDIVYTYGTEVDLKLADFFASTGGSYLVSGGEITAATGLHINVTAGTGFIRRYDPYNDLKTITWDAVVNLDLGANTDNYIVYDLATEGILVQAGTASQSQIALGLVVTDGSSIRCIHLKRQKVQSLVTDLYEYLLSTRQFALKSGLAGSAGTTPRNITIDPGIYYIALDPITFDGVTDATFSSFYGTNGATETTSLTQLDITNYALAGALQEMTNNYHRTDTVAITSCGRVVVIYGTEQYELQSAAAEADIQPLPSFINTSGFYIMNIVVKKGTGIVQVIDIRPQPASVTGVGVSGISDHSALSHLAVDDHKQYLLVTGSRAMTGSLSMGNYDITSVGNVDGVDVSSHHTRHLPGGSDPITTANPVTILVGATIHDGDAASLSKSDHQHGIITGTPSTIATSNDEGTSSAVARLDHIHAHGSQLGGTTHAVATSGLAGFESASDKIKLDSITVAYIPSSDQKDALSGTDGIPSLANLYVTDSDSRLVDDRTPLGHASSHNVGGSDVLAIDASASTGSLRTLGTSATSACAGNDSRLSNDRAPTTHAANHRHSGSDEVSTATAAANAIPKANSAGKIDIAWIPTGTLSTQVCLGNDSRLSDSRTDSNALHKTISSEIYTLTEKTLPVNTDLFLIEDSADSYSKKKTQLSALRTLRQTAFTQVSGADTTTTSTSFTDLLTISITTGANPILIFATASVSNSNNNREVYMRVLVDGVSLRGAAVTLPVSNQAETMSIVLKTPTLTATSHTIKLQWKTSANTAQCRPISSAIDAEHASLLVEEVLV